MDLVNLDGLTLIGQGSEWFWTMLQMILLTVTVIVLGRQLKAQAATNAQARIESLYARWSTYDMQHRRLVAALHLRYEGIQSGVWPGSLTWEKIQPIVIYINDVAGLVRHGHITLDEVDLFRDIFRDWHLAFRPFYEAAGERAFSPDDTVWLIAQMEARDVSKGRRSTPLMTTPEWLDDVIDRTTQNLRLEQDRKAGIIPGRPAVAANA